MIVNFRKSLEKDPRNPYFYCMSQKFHPHSNEVSLVMLSKPKDCVIFDIFNCPV